LRIELSGIGNTLKTAHADLSPKTSKNTYSFVYFVNQILLHGDTRVRKVLGKAKGDELRTYFINHN
jgi:hypothetical protein